MTFKLRFCFPVAVLAVNPLHTFYLRCLSVIIFPPADSSTIHAPPPYSSVAVVTVGVGLHKLWGGLTFGKGWEAADVCVGQDVCKKQCWILFFKPQQLELSHSYDRHNLGALTSASTHNLLVNTICIHCVNGCVDRKPYTNMRAARLLFRLICTLNNK